MQQKLTPVMRSTIDRIKGVVAGVRLISTVLALALTEAA